MKEEFRGTIKSTERITEDNSTEVRHIVVEVNSQSSGRLDVGMNLGVLVPGPHEFGNEFHQRLYAIAGISESDDKYEVDLCVRRCNYIDEVNGEKYKGVASNYLCDLESGEEISFSGIQSSPFDVPKDKKANLILIAQGTGIAAFRGLIKKIYKEHGGWEGKVRLFYGANTGMDLLYMNDKKNDMELYYDEETFKAFKAVSPRPHFADPEDYEQSFKNNKEEIKELLSSPDSHIYISGLESLKDQIGNALSEVLDSGSTWQEQKSNLIQSARWSELYY